MDSESENISTKTNVCDIKNPIIFKKAKLSVFRLFEKLRSTSFHSKKYYEKIVNAPEISQEEVTEQIVEKSNEAVTVQRSKKKRLFNTIFLLFNLAIVVGILLWNFLGNSESIDISQLLTQEINWIWLVVGVLLFILINEVDSLRIFTLVLHVTKRPRPFLCYKSTAMCRFYDSITPLATGGQPFQVFYLNKRGLPAATATSVPIAKYLYSQFFSMIFVAIVLILQSNYIVSLSPFMITMCYIGFILNVVLIGGILFLSLSKKVAPSCAIGILKLLSKMKIVKDYRKAFVKVMHTVRDYVTTMRQFIKNGWIAVAMFFLSAFFMILSATIPFVVYATFVPLGADWFTWYVKFFTIAVVCDMACCFIPLPGATGMAEISFAALFAQFFKPAVVVWALLLWRIFTYYGVLLQGLIVMLYDYLYGNKKIAPLLAKFKAEDLAREQKLLSQGDIKVVKNKERRK